MTCDADYRAAGAVVTTSFDAARAVATGDALRRFATEIAVIGGAEIYAQWMDRADRLAITGFMLGPKAIPFSPPSMRSLGEVARVRIRPAGR